MIDQQQQGLGVLAAPVAIGGPGAGQDGGALGWPAVEEGEGLRQRLRGQAQDQCGVRREERREAAQQVFCRGGVGRPDGQAGDGADRQRLFEQRPEGHRLQGHRLTAAGEAQRAAIVSLVPGDDAVAGVSGEQDFLRAAGGADVDVIAAGARCCAAGEVVAGDVEEVASISGAAVHGGLSIQRRDIGVGEPQLAARKRHTRCHRAAAQLHPVEQAKPAHAFS